MTERHDRLLGISVLLYAAASLLHFVHNAEHLHSYPNLPEWLGRGDVYAAWFGLAALGATGYVLHRIGFELAGLCLLGLYAVFGFAGLLHYTLAPMAAHTSAMNFTIWFEALAAVSVLAAVVIKAR
jgi:hypothetical protein